MRRDARLVHVAARRVGGRRQRASASSRHQGPSKATCALTTWPMRTVAERLEAVRARAAARRPAHATPSDRQRDDRGARTQALAGTGLDLDAVGECAQRGHGSVQLHAFAERAPRRCVERRGAAGEPQREAAVVRAAMRLLRRHRQQRHLGDRHGRAADAEQRLGDRQAVGDRRRARPAGRPATWRRARPRRRPPTVRSGSSRAASVVEVALQGARSARRPRRAGRGRDGARRRRRPGRRRACPCGGRRRRRWPGPSPRRAAPAGAGARRRARRRGTRRRARPRRRRRSPWRRGRRADRAPRAAPRRRPAACNCTAAAMPETPPPTTIASCTADTSGRRRCASSRSPRAAGRRTPPSGRISRLCASCSSMCALQPAVRAQANVAGYRSGARSTPPSTAAAQYSTFVSSGRFGLFSASRRSATSSTWRASAQALVLAAAAPRRREPSARARGSYAR